MPYSVSVCPCCSNCWHLGATCLNEYTALDEAPTQHNFDACLMTSLKAFFLETLGLTFECCPWNLPKCFMLTLATDFSFITLKYSPWFHSTKYPPTKHNAITDLLFCQKIDTFCWCPEFSFFLSLVGTNLFLLGRQSFVGKRLLVGLNVIG